MFGFGARDRVMAPEPVELRLLPLHPLLDGGRVLLALPLEALGRALGIAVVSISKAPEHEFEELREFLGTALDLLRRALG